MTIDVTMPALSPTMESGTLANWLVKEGEAVSAGDAIAEIETDKATMEVESIDEGRMGKILVAAGTEDVPVGTRIAVLLEEGEDDSALEEIDAEAAEKPAATKAEQDADTQDQETETPAKAETKAAAPAKSGEDSGKAAKTETDTDAKAPPAPETEEGERVFASPLARRLAEQKGVDLTQVEGSGPKARIVKADVEAATERAPAAAKAPAEAKEKPAQAPASTSAPGVEPPADVPYEEERLTGMRKVIAQRMTQSKQHVPHFYLTIDVALDSLLEQRKALNAKLEGDGVKLSVNDFLIRASALSLKAVPDANAMFAGDRMLKFTRQDISVAVAVEGGLVTPVIRDAGGKGLKEISSEMKALAEKAQAGKLTPEEYQGGTFSLSNLGMFGIREFAAVINPPQGAILAVGQGEKRPVVENDAVAIKTMMTVTLAVDHRAMDGAIGARFLAAFKERIEDPATMLL